MLNAHVALVHDRKKPIQYQNVIYIFYNIVAYRNIFYQFMKGKNSFKVFSFSLLQSESMINFDYVTFQLHLFIKNLAIFFSAFSHSSNLQSKMTLDSKFW